MNGIRGETFLAGQEGRWDKQVTRQCQDLDISATIWTTYGRKANINLIGPRTTRQVAG